MKLMKYVFVTSALLIGLATTGKTSYQPAEAIQTSTLKIWLDRSNWENDGAIVKLEYGTNLDATNNISAISGSIVEPSGYVENSAMTRWYSHYEVPTSIIGKEMVFRRFNSTSTILWNSSLKYTFSEGMNNQMWYIWSDWSGTITQGSVDATNGAFLKYVLEGYMTCSNSISNGYGAYPTLISTYFMNGEVARYADSLTDDLVNDFSTEENYASGTKDTTVSVQDKIDLMGSLYEAENPGSGFPPMIADNNARANTGAIISLLSLASLLSLGYLILVKKLKRS